MGRITPPFGQPKSSHGPWQANPFNVEMSPTATVKRVGAFSDQLYLGLLSRLPDPDGVGCVELDCPGYIRQLVELVPRSSSHLTIPRAVLFELEGGRAVLGAGLFDAEGTEAEAYGVLRSSRIAWHQPEQIFFPSYQIMVRRPSVRR